MFQQTVCVPFPPAAGRGRFLTAPPVSSPHTLGQQYFREETSLNCYKGSGCYPSDVCGAYLTTSSSALRISIAPKDTASPVVADIRRTTIYNGSTVETETLNGTSISGSLSLDGTVYTNSQENHSMCIRQQAPVTKLWSLCQVDPFLSAGGARCSVRIQWSEYDVSYEVPAG